MVRPFESRRPFSNRRSPSPRRSKRGSGSQRLATMLEQLESRRALTINTAFNDTTGVLTLTYDAVADQQAVLEIEEVLIPLNPTTNVSVPMVNLYASSNAASGGFAFGDFRGTSVALGPYASGQFIGVNSIIVNVTNYDALGVNNNSLTIKGVSTDADRIIIAGSGRSAGGRWSDEGAFAPLKSEVLIATTGIDNLTVTAGGVINVSGSFTNDTNDASINAIGQSVEDTLATPQTARVTIGDAAPVTGVLPQPYLSSNFIQVVGASLDIYGDIVATDSVILSAGAGAPTSSRSNLVLPFDITVTGNPGTGDGVVSLFSTKNIVQLQSSTIISPRLVAVSNATNLAAPDGPWMIDLGTATNDFDSISLGMVAAPGDKTTIDTEGRIGVRDIDDLTIADFGILAATGQVSIQTGGGLTFAAPVTATGLSATSNDSITSLPAAVFQLGDLGLSLSASDTFSPTSTGDIALAGRININDTNPSVLVTNKLQAAGALTITGGIFSPLAGSTTLSGVTGVTVAGPIQVGSTKLDANSRTIEIFDHDLICISDTGSITVNNVVGNNAVPFSLQATNIISFDAADNVNIAGSVFAGTLYGNPSALITTEALPAITIRANEEVNLLSTGSLRTSSYENNFKVTTNPLVGLISITGAARINSDGSIRADGAFDVDVTGDVYLNGPTTARENIAVKTSAGSISVAGKMTSTGATYTAAVDEDSQRMPNVILSALNGGIITGNTGTISAGTVVIGGTKTFGRVDLEAQQGIDIGAAIDTVGAVTATTKLGAVELSALLRTGNFKAAVIAAGNGISQTDPDLARIVTDSLTLTNTGAAGGPSDIDLFAKNNQIKTVTATNFAVGGDIKIRNTGPIAIGGLLAERDDLLPSTITLASSAGMTQTGAIQANDLVVSNTSASAIALTNSANDVDRFAANNPTGSVSFVDADGFETGVLRGKPLTVEVRADGLSLSSVAPNSVVRVVSGLQYRTLNIAAGTSSGTTVGTVEFVTTSSVDNAATKAPFAGTLRDMIRYANDNGATYVINNTRRAQPMSIVFDEDGYLVEEVTLAGALPTVIKPLRVDGGRLEASATETRVGILGNAKIPAGLTFGVGSSGSSVNEAAIYGFTKGTGIVLNSSNNTVTSTFLGLKADGSVSSNRIGLEMVGSGATGNLVGTTVFDRLTANRIGGNTEAGILIRESANGNRVFGNVIGTHDDGTGPIGAANGDGVRIFKASGNAIGTPDAVQPDLTTSVSNIIAGNTSSGVHILSSAAGSFATANSVRNNLISANQGTATASGTGAGITIRSSRFALIGGDGDGAGNAIVGQAGTKLPVHAVAIADSTDLRVYGNSVGVESDGFTLNGNTGDGVNVLRSQRVDIAAGNVIVSNAGHGVAIGTGSTAVTVAANRIGILSDDTPAGNLGDGVSISTAVGNTVGAGNLIANNTNGVTVANSRATTSATSNRILGSEIFANVNSGVRIVGGSRTVIGGTAAGNGNVIRENLGDGIRVESSTTTGAATGHLIQGNFIGTNDNRDIDLLLGNAGDGIRITDGVQNTVSTGNVVLNNGGDGVNIVNGTGNVVGGSALADGNVISANAVNGVSIRLAGATGRATGHRIYGNQITGNAQNGVEVVGAKVTSVWIGQDMTTATVGGRGNVITDNGNAGVRIDAAQQVSVQGNSIADNAFAGIQLANNANTSRATALTLTSAVRQQPSGGGPQVVVSGSLRGLAQQQYSVDLYASPASDGNPVTGADYQGRRFIGRLTVTADRTGFARFTLTVSADVTLGDFITATATSLRFGIGSTTAFSNGVELLLPPPSPPRR